MSLSRRGSFFEVEISEDEEEDGPKNEFLSRVPEETEERDQITELKSSSVSDEVGKASGRSLTLINVIYQLSKCKLGIRSTQKCQPCKSRYSFFSILLESASWDLFCIPGGFFCVLNTNQTC